MRTEILAVIAVLAITVGCKEKHEPCSGMKFDPVTLPTTFTVKNQSTVLGKVTMDADQNATFEADPSADAEKLARFKEDFDGLVASGAAQFDYSDHDGEDTHFSCGGSVKKGTPDYPAAFKMALYSDDYELEDSN